MFFFYKFNLDYCISKNSCPFLDIQCKEIWENKSRFYKAAQNYQIIVILAHESWNDGFIWQLPDTHEILIRYSKYTGFSDRKPTG